MLGRQQTQGSQDIMPRQGNQLQLKLQSHYSSIVVSLQAVLLHPRDWLQYSSATGLKEVTL